MAADPGSAIPKDSARAFIVEAVPIVLQWPTDGVLGFGLDSGVIYRGFRNLLPSGDVVHKLMFVNVTRGEKLSPMPQYSACSSQSFLGVTVEHRPHVHTDSRDILKENQHRSRSLLGLVPTIVAAAIKQAGVVLSHPVSNTTPSRKYPVKISTKPRYARLRSSVAVGRLEVS